MRIPFISFTRHSHSTDDRRKRKEENTMINTALLEKFKMKQTADAANLKSHIGETIRVDNCEFSEYTDVDGRYHNVLAVSIADSKDIYRTEVSAFIDKFKVYWDIFGEAPIEERPLLKIIGKKSKKQNDYISFELVDENGNTL